MTTMIAKPSMMPQRRQESSPATTAKPVERTFRRRTGYMSNTTLADQLAAVVNPELLYRPACNEATDRVEDYGSTMPEGKMRRRWLPETVANASALLENWFGLAAESEKLNVAPGVRAVTRRFFVEVCVELKVVGAPGQKAEWYSSLEEQVQAAHKPSKNTRPTVKSTEKTKEVRSAKVIADKATPKPSEKTEPKTTTTAVISNVKPEGKKGAEQHCEEAIGHLQRYARKHIERNGGRKSQRWSETTLDLAVTLLKAYFFGTPHGALEEQLKDSVAKETRNRFAYACIKHGLSNLPGQQAAWYGEVEKSTRRFIDSQLIAKAS